MKQLYGLIRLGIQDITVERRSGVPDKLAVQIIGMEAEAVGQGPVS